MKNTELLMAFLFRRHNRIREQETEKNNYNSVRLVGFLCALSLFRNSRQTLLSSYKPRPKPMELHFDFPTQQSCPSLGNALIVLFVRVPPFTTHIRLGQWQSFKVWRLNCLLQLFSKIKKSSMNRDLRISSILGKRSTQFMKTFVMLKL